VKPSAASLPQATSAKTHQPTALRATPLAAALALWVGALLLLLAAYWVQRPQLEADIGNAGDQGFVSLWGGREQNDEASFRWSGGRSALHIYGFEGRTTLLTLRLSATRPVGEPAAMLSVAQETQALGSWAVAREWRRYALLLPPQPSSEQTLLLDSSLWEPGGRDGRRLGVALDYIWAIDTAQRGVLPPLGRWLFLSLLPLLAFVIAQRWRRDIHAALVLGVATTLVLALGVAFFPAPIAYALPSLWLTLGFAALLLLIAPLRRTSRARWPALGGAGMLLAAGLLTTLGLALIAQRLWLAGGVLAGCGALLLVVNYAPQARSTQHAARSTQHAALALAAITVLALTLRLYRLDTLPLGIWQDEARHGMAALEILRDQSYRPVYASEVDLPAGVFYAIVPSLALFDVSTWSLRLPMALAGALLPLALYALARPLWGTMVALSSAALIGCASWSLSLSRIAWPTIFDPLLLLVALALLWRATRSGLRVALPLALLSGLFTGLDAYTYHTGRLAPFWGLWLLLIVALWQYTAGTRSALLKHILVVGLVWAASLALTLTPLITYAANDPEGFSKRVSGVSLFGGSVAESGSPLALLAQSSLAYGGMLHVAGDPNGRHHLPGRPLLDPLTGTLSLIGLLWALHQWRTPPAALLLGWLGLGLAAGVFSTGGPHAMRAVGALAPSLVLAAIGLREAVHHLGGKQSPWRRALLGGITPK
jgi:hypothetical protein